MVSSRIPGICCLQAGSEVIEILSICIWVIYQEVFCPWCLNYMTTAFSSVLITSLALKSTRSAMWVVQIIARQLIKWKLILSTPLHHPDSSPNTGRNINKNKNISKALIFEVLQLEILSQGVNQIYGGSIIIHCKVLPWCVTFIPEQANEKKESVTETSILTVHHLVWASQKGNGWQYPGFQQGCVERTLRLSWLLLQEGDFSGGIKDWWINAAFVALQLVRIMVFCTVFHFFSHWSQCVSSCCLP